jgi:hypothetical protein
MSNILLNKKKDILRNKSHLSKIKAKLDLF